MAQAYIICGKGKDEGVNWMPTGKAVWEVLTAKR